MGPCSLAEPHLHGSLGAHERGLGSLVGEELWWEAGLPPLWVLPGVRHSVGGCGWANEAPHCQGGVEELRQVLGEVSFVGWAESWPCAILLGCGGLPRPQPTLSPAPCPTDRPKERIREGEGTIRDMARGGGVHRLWEATPLTTALGLGSGDLRPVSERTLVCTQGMVTASWADLDFAA